LVIGDIVHSSATVEWNVAHAAGALAAAGIGAGDRVALLLRNDIAFVEATLAAVRLGAIAVPINWHSAGEELEFILRDCGARVLVAHRDLHNRARASVPADVTAVVIEPSAPVVSAHGLSAVATCPLWEDWLAGYDGLPVPAEATGSSTFNNTLSYTSGTTGRPKGVLRRQNSPPSTATMQSPILRPGLRHLVSGPLYHAAPNSAALSVINAAGLVVIQPKFDAADLLALVERHRIQHLMMVPTMSVRLLDLPDTVRTRHDVSSIDFAIHGAGACPPSVKEAMIDWWGPVIYEYYGGTEAGMATFCTSADALAHPGPSGVRCPECRCAYLTTRGRP
jgi:long-chain acyl-CoA synthetase